MTVATRTQPDVTTDTPSEYKANIDASLQVDGEIAGQFAPHEQATPDMTVAVDAGRLMIDGVLTTVSNSTGTITAPSASNYRWDRVVMAYDGSVSVVTGTEDTDPFAIVKPDIPAGYYPICAVALQDSTTAITNSLIIDERVMNYTASNLGEFTPELWDSSNSGSEGQTYTYQLGTYCKTGNVVNFSIHITMSSLGTLTATNTARIGGLPFAPKNHGSSRPMGFGVITAASGLNLAGAYTITGHIEQNDSKIYLRKHDLSSGVSSVQINEITASGSFSLSGSYIAED